jgi:16S rRNA (guanine(966)-N(2))-methyltransferase RsmD
MRVIAGNFRSRTLQALDGLETRPTYDRLKETLFNVLHSAGKVEERRWADLFAGTGAIGIEALSRGAESVHFAEIHAAASRVLRGNLATLGLTAPVAERDAAEALRQWEKSGVQFDVIFLDPPYRMRGCYGEVLRTVGRGGVLAAGGVVVAEHEKRFDPGEGEGCLERYRTLKQGESALSFYRMKAVPDEGGQDEGGQDRGAAAAGASESEEA